MTLPNAPGVEVPSRDEFDALPAELLSKGGSRNPDVVRVDFRGRTLVVKDFAPRNPCVRESLGRWITAREARAWRRLDGHPDVPRFYGDIDALAFAVEYRPGRRLSRSLSVDEDFLPKLERAVEEMHARGIVHLDLKHRDTVLADAAGKPVLIDFGSAVIFRPGSLGARLLLPLLARIDRGAVRKWQRKLVATG